MTATREHESCRKRHPCLRRRRFLTGEPANGREIADVTWHGTRLHAPNWDDPHGRFLAYTLTGVDDSQAELHILFNMSDAGCEAELPKLSGRVWHRVLDTSIEFPHHRHGRLIP